MTLQLAIPRLPSRRRSVSASRNLAEHLMKILTERLRSCPSLHKDNCSRFGPRLRKSSRRREETYKLPDGNMFFGGAFTEKCGSADEDPPSASARAVFSPPPLKGKLRERERERTFVTLLWFTYWWPLRKGQTRRRPTSSRFSDISRVLGVPASAEGHEQSDGQAEFSPVWTKPCGPCAVVFCDLHTFRQGSPRVLCP